MINEEPRHPLPQSDEARHDEIPETFEREKGKGEDKAQPTRGSVSVNPDGEPYRCDDLWR